MKKRLRLTERDHKEKEPADGSLQDEQLIRRILRGERELYGELARKYQDRVFNTCWRICGHLEDARDVTQDALIKAFERLDGFRGESGFYTWLFRIAVNLALTRRRDASRRRLVSLDSDDLAPSQAARLAQRGAAKSRRSVGEEAEVHQCVARALQELDNDARAVIVLRDIEGLDYRTIAEILDVPPGTVKSRLHRARTLLGELIRPTIKADG